MELFSPEHLAAIAATALGAIMLAVLPRRIAPGRAQNIARALALVIAAGFVIEQATYLARGTWESGVNLPLQLSDAATLATVAALWSARTGLLTELVWYWALTATLQALLTPDLGYAFPDVLYFTYFATHGGVIAAACLLVLGMRLVPRPWASLRVFAMTAAFAVLAAIGCLATGGNYMYLRDKPANGSILDAMGPWPWYLVAATLLGLATLLVLEAIARAVARGERASHE